MIAKLPFRLKDLIIIWIVTFFCNTQLNAQLPPEKIDLSTEFQKIEEYNNYIKTANRYHYLEQKRKGKKVGLFLGTLAAAGAAIYLGFVDDLGIGEDFRYFVVGGVAGVSYLLGTEAFKEDSWDYYQYEQDALNKAKALFNKIPKK